MPWLHDVQIIVGIQAEQIEHLVEHLPVLAGNAHLSVKALIGGKRQSERSHFDGLGPRAEHAKGF
ncbi:hypothetical protein D3C85_1695690 [compost metagenome]